jgi:hypothetical protein
VRPRSAGQLRQLGAPERGWRLTQGAAPPLAPADVMKNVNTVKIDELSDEQILAARARRSRERCGRLGRRQLARTAASGPWWRSAGAGAGSPGALLLLQGQSQAVPGGHRAAGQPPLRRQGAGERRISSAWPPQLRHPCARQMPPCLPQQRAGWPSGPSCCATWPWQAGRRVDGRPGPRGLMHGTALQRTGRRRRRLGPSARLRQPSSPPTNLTGLQVTPEEDEAIRQRLSSKGADGGGAASRRRRRQ